MGSELFWPHRVPLHEDDGGKGLAVEPVVGFNDGLKDDVQTGLEEEVHTGLEEEVHTGLEEELHTGLEEVVQTGFFVGLEVVGQYVGFAEVVWTGPPALH